uniref:Uncharacterized protein n=1 Tax=Picea glauca TaxID=3330 RepID=A0A101M2B1_PICGL|nr:hypothetical protein ABT39_MTgene2917 [Picea glauca]QHR87856.1 hypothetical protein Q903MT_gene1868 [Picea sitchensis]
MKEGHPNLLPHHRNRQQTFSSYQAHSLKRTYDYSPSWLTVLTKDRHSALPSQRQGKKAQIHLLQKMSLP